MIITACRAPTVLRTMLRNFRRLRKFLAHRSRSFRIFTAEVRRTRRGEFEPGFRSRTGSHEQGTNLPQRRQCVLPLRRRQLSVRCVTTVSKWSCEPEPKKTLKLTVECLRCSRFVPSSFFNCGIRLNPNSAVKPTGTLRDCVTILKIASASS
jgi:hypothetical protein